MSRCAVPLACGGDDGQTLVDAGVDARVFDTGPPTGGGPYPAPGAWGANAGPGGPKRTFTAPELLQNCAFLDGGDADPDDHHNLVQMYDGYLVLPFAPEYGMSGGLAFFDISDPCAPVRVGVGAAARMRETHSIGFAAHGGRWAVTNSLTWEPEYGGGIEFWDVTNPTAPVEGAVLNLPGFFYPDAYARPVLSVFWQAPYVYVAGADNGIYVVDATFPDAPVLLTTYPIQPTLRVGQIQVIGNLLIATAAEGARALLLDVSDPANPQPIPGGDFLARDAGGVVREAYFTTAANGKLYFARKDSGGGVIIYDIADPTTPTYVGSFASTGNGGYVFVKDQFAFVGEGSVARIYDLTDPQAITIAGELHLTGDLDTMTPIGNVVVLSVDDEADPDRGSAIAPWQLDARHPGAAGDVVVPRRRRHRGAAHLAGRRRPQRAGRRAQRLRRVGAPVPHRHRSGDHAHQRLLQRAGDPGQLLALPAAGAEHRVHPRDPGGRARRSRRQRPHRGVQPHLHHGELMRRRVLALLAMAACGGGDDARRRSTPGLRWPRTPAPMSTPSSASRWTSTAPPRPARCSTPGTSATASAGTRRARSPSPPSPTPPPAATRPCSPPSTPAATGAATRWW